MRKAASYTPEARGKVMAAITARVELGVSLADAAVAEDARPETVRGWLRRGRRDPEGPYADFAAAVNRAREEASNRLEPMDADELGRVVSDMVRGGSVQAAKLLWEMLRAAASDAGEEVKDDDDPLAEVDELALEPFERTYLSEHFEGISETVVLIGKKNGKSSTLAALSLFQATSGEAARDHERRTRRSCTGACERRRHPPAGSTEGCRGRRRGAREGR